MATRVGNTAFQRIAPKSMFVLELRRAFLPRRFDVSVRVIFGGPEILAYNFCGELTIGELGTPPGITAIGNGQRFKIIGSACRAVSACSFCKRQLKRMGISEVKRLAHCLSAVAAIGI